MEGTKDSEATNSQTHTDAEIECIMKRRALILESLNLIPVYTGQDPNWSLEQFRTKFTALADFLHWPIEDQFFAIQQRLAGLALQTCQNFKHKIRSVQDVFNILKEKFETNRDQGDILNDFWSFKQQPDMSVAEFLAKANAKAKIAITAHELPTDCVEKTKDQWLISMLQKNLLPQIRKGVIARNPSTLKHLEEIALLEERAYKAVPMETFTQEQGENFYFAMNSRNKTITDRDEDKSYLQSFARDLKEQLSEIRFKINQLENRNNINKRDSVACWNCGKFDHIQRNCKYKHFTDNRNTRFPQRDNRFTGGQGHSGRNRETFARDRYQGKSVFTEQGRNEQNFMRKDLNRRTESTFQTNPKTTFANENLN